MKVIRAFSQKLLNLRLVFVTALAAILLLTTACNNGNEVGARPYNPPVQMGGQNNPHKGGGDGYTEFNTDRKPVQNLDRGQQAPKSDRKPVQNLDRGQQAAKSSGGYWTRRSHSS